jgi:hypothetical protein
MESLSVEAAGGVDLALVAAQHYRSLRAQGVTVRSPIDVLVASLLHRKRLRAAAPGPRTSTPSKLRAACVSGGIETTMRTNITIRPLAERELIQALTDLLHLACALLAAQEFMLQKESASR